jgi:hypothetical protein
MLWELEYENGKEREKSIKIETRNKDATPTIFSSSLFCSFFFTATKYKSIMIEHLSKP